MLLALAWLASAGVPDSVRPVVSPMNTQAQVERWRASRGVPPATLACTTLWAGEAQLCFRKGPGAVGYVTLADLKSWEVDTDALIGVLRERSAERVEAQLQPVDIDGMKARYWIGTNADGWAGALVLHPERVGRVVGTPTLFAAPANGIVIAWRGGDAATDKVVAVGATEIHASQPGSISPVVHRWTGTEWTPWAEAVRAPSEAP